MGIMNIDYEKKLEELDGKENEISRNLQEIQTWKREVEIYRNMNVKSGHQIKSQEGTIVKKDAKITELVDEVKQEKG